jgi:putative Ca2+/H+ antiporter (TMEM165/GDT1 family)
VGLAVSVAVAAGTNVGVKLAAVVGVAGGTFALQAVKSRNKRITLKSRFRMKHL